MNSDYKFRAIVHVSKFSKKKVMQYLPNARERS